MIRFVRLCSSCAFCVIGLGCCLASPVTSPKGYSLTPATGWFTDQSGRVPGDDLTTFTKPDKGTEIKLGVRVTKAPNNINLEGAKQFVNKQYPKQFTHWTLVSQTFSSLGGVRDLDTTATCLFGSPARQMRVRQVIVIKAGSLYFFTSGVPEDDHAQYDKAVSATLRSVRWTARG